MLFHGSKKIILILFFVITLIVVAYLIFRKMPSSDKKDSPPEMENPIPERETELPKQQLQTIVEEKSDEIDKQINMARKNICATDNELDFGKHPSDPADKFWVFVPSQKHDGIATQDE